MDNTQSRTSTTQTYSDAAVSRAIYRTEWGRTQTGLLSIKYSNMRQRINGDHGGRYEGIELLPKSEFIAWALNDPAFTSLFGQWHEASCIYKLAPSIDRIDNTGGYTRENIRFITQSENASRGAAEMWKARKAAVEARTEAVATS